MKTLLVIRSSLNADQSQSGRMADRFIDQWRAAHPGGRVVVRDVARQAIPHIDAERFGAFLAKPEQRTAGQQAIVAMSDELIAELRSADAIVLAVPMYNFGIPSTLKAYFDHVARVGETFRYTESGPVGLLTGKKAYVFAARGGLYAGTPLDSQTPYLRTFLGFLGITDVEFVYAEGLAISDDSRSRALSAAHAHIDGLLQPELQAA